LNQLWRFFGGAATLALVPFFLSPETQGFWYTFGGVSALFLFADLGFSSIVMQYAAHEFAFLGFGEGYRLEGPEDRRGRLASLFRFVMRWAIRAVLLAWPIVFAVGCLLFGGKPSQAGWLAPWLLFSLASALVFLGTILAAFLQGCDEIAGIQRIALGAAVWGMAVLLLSLIAGLGLYSLALGTMASSALYLISMARRYRKFLGAMLTSGAAPFERKGEILALLRKYALSWSSGYLIFQIYTPFMFHFFGPEEAGKAGITMSLAQAAFGLSATWLTAATPRMNMLVAKREWKKLDAVFMVNLARSCGTYIAGIACLALGILLFGRNERLLHSVFPRFLGALPIAMLATGWFLQLFVSGMAAYLRAHKDEPYVGLSLVSGLIILATTWACVRFLGSNFLFSGFLLSFAYALPVGNRIFRKKREEWHA
jgi:hypothetical protein